MRFPKELTALADEWVQSSSVTITALYQAVTMVLRLVVQVVLLVLALAGYLMCFLALATTQALVLASLSMQNKMR